MEELKYLADVYEKASEELKQQPAFLKVLKEVESAIKEIHNPPQYFPNIKVKQEGDKIVITTMYSLHQEPKAEEKIRLGREIPNRVAVVYTIGLDEHHNLSFEETGTMIDSKTTTSLEKGTVIDRGVTCHSRYESRRYASGTETVVERVFSEQEKPSELNLIPMPRGNSVRDFESYYDKELLKAIDVNMHITKDWVVWKASRTTGNLSEAWISEAVRCDGPTGYGIEVRKGTYKCVNMSTPSVMRIDPPYGPRTISSEMIETFLGEGKGSETGRGRR